MSRKSAALDHQPFSGRPFGWLQLAALAVTLAVAPAAVAQNADTSAINAYLKAITQPAGSSRAAALESFAAAHPNSSLKLDALEWIVWEEKQTHNDAAAAKFARELLAVDGDNAVALAMLVDRARRGQQAAPAYVEMAKRGSGSVARLRRPEGMSHADFTALRQQVGTMLNAALGYAALEAKDYAAARAPLAKAVAASPNDAQLVYALALADLSGEKPDRQQGYWLLARAVNLSGGPAAARQIEEFGRKKYRGDGGSDRDWDQYLASTAAPGVSAAMVVGASGVAHVSDVQGHGAETRATQMTRATQAPRARQSGATADATSQAAKTKAESKNGKAREKKEVATKRAPKPSKSGWKGEPEPEPESSAAANALPPISGAAQPRVRAGPPVSLGILIETALTRKPTREAIVYSLSDLVRHLGLNDEAFILSFSDDLVFEEDLTGNAQRLQQAMDQIKPHPGTALLDAIGFAAGHLQRIASNQNRVLLVISDGRNDHSRIPALAASGEIRASGVKIHCIGVEVGARESMYRLQALANGTGGTAAFITAPDQFRAATQQVAGRIGIPFQF